MTTQAPKDIPMPVYQRMVWWYLAAPVLIFLPFWYTPLLGLPLAAGLAWLVWRHTARCLPVTWDIRLIARMALTLLLAWLLMRGAFAMTGLDWPKHYAVFYDLTRCHWPIGYALDGTHYLFSYYIPYYLPAAAMATLIGPPSLARAAELWTVLGYALALWGYFRRSRSLPEWVFLFLLLMSFANWNIFEYVWTTKGISIHHDPYISPFHWVPQHVLPVWLGAALFFDRETTPQARVRFGVPLLALIAYWSPMVALGFAAFVLAEVCSQNPVRTSLAHWRLYLFSLCLVAPYYLYLSRSLTSVESGFNTGHGEVLASYYGYFIVLALVVVLWVVRYFPLSRDHRRHLLTALALLLVAPLYHFGYFNDLSKRITMVAYYALLLIVSDAALHLLRTLKPKQGGDPRLTQLGFIAILLIASLSPVHRALPPLSSPVIPPVHNERFFPPAAHGLQHEITAAQGLIKDLGLKFQYIAALSSAKRAILREVQTCPPQPAVTPAP